MSHELQFYIDGAWVAPLGTATLDVIDPSTEEAYTKIAMGTVEDVNRAVAAAKAAFPSYSQTSREERIALLKKIAEVYQTRYQDIAQAISKEMGAPTQLAMQAQAAMGIGHLNKMIEVLSSFEFEHLQGTTLIAREPIGVCGFITPWNWPMNQIVCKVAPALAAGCTMVLKPSEIAPIDAVIFAEVLDAAGVPKGVFNLVHGDGPTVGQAIASHPDVDMVSFTGSTRAGVLVAKAAADTVKRVHQELGGKSANILLADVDLRKAVTKGVTGCFGNSGQSCNAPTRMFVQKDQHDEAIAIAKAAAANFKVGPPAAEGTVLGPVVSEVQYNKIQKLIQAGIDEGATLVTGGTGRPEGLNRGYYVQPTIFGNVTPGMTIAREEIFGPVLAILPYETEEEAVRLANDTVYGLAASVWSNNLSAVHRIVPRLQAGVVWVNAHNVLDNALPLGGVKQSGYGRDLGRAAVESFTELKSVCMAV